MTYVLEEFCSSSNNGLDATEMLSGAVGGEAREGKRYSFTRISEKTKEESDTSVIGISNAARMMLSTASTENCNTQQVTF